MCGRRWRHVPHPTKSSWLSSKTWRGSMTIPRPSKRPPRGSVTAVFLRAVDDGHVMHIIDNEVRYAFDWVQCAQVNALAIRAIKSGWIQRNAEGVVYELTDAGRKRLATIDQEDSCPPSNSQPRSAKTKNASTASRTSSKRS